MNEAIQSLADLSPLAAIVIIAGVAATVITQVAKRAQWTKGQTEAVALGISGVLGVAAYIVSGLTGVFPASFVEAVSTGLVIIAGVAVTSRAAYALLGHAIPDGTTPEPSAAELAAAQSRLARESVETRQIAVVADMKADEAAAVAESASNAATHRADG